MSVTWDPTQYHRYGDLRLRPALDLFARISVDSPVLVHDIGTGGGEIARLATVRWPSAQVVGSDSSIEMLEQARVEPSAVEWQRLDIAEWQPAAEHDVIYSNAVLHWLPDHGELFPRLVGGLRDGGQLAVQMPMSWWQPSHQSIRASLRELGTAEGDALADSMEEPNVNQPSFYWDAIRPARLSARHLGDHIPPGPDRRGASIRLGQREHPAARICRASCQPTRSILGYLPREATFRLSAATRRNHAVSLPSPIHRCHQMIFNIAPNVTAGSVRDAARLLLPTRRLVSRRRVRRLATARSHEERDQFLHRWSAELVRALDLDIAATGLNHVGAGPYVVVALHEGLVDVPILINTLSLPLTFVARASLDRELPVPGLLDASGQIVINPEAPSSLRAMLRGAAQVAAQGRSIATFPQGSVLGIETTFQPGPRIVAQHLELPVLPIAMWGSARAWDHPFSSRVTRGVKVRVDVLEPRMVSSPREYRALEQELKAVALADSEVVPRHYVPSRDGFWDGFNFDIDADFPEVAAEVTHHRGALVTG